LPRTPGNSLALGLLLPIIAWQSNNRPPLMMRTTASCDKVVFVSLLVTYQPVNRDPPILPALSPVLLRKWRRTLIVD
jgi:hypothetical protein